jgi:hypothetical protein
VAVGTSPAPEKVEEQRSYKITPPSIFRSNDAGVIQGIGEKFAANPVTGTVPKTIPIATSPIRSGIGPQLPHSYNSGAGNGPLGGGWNLSLHSIARKTYMGLPCYLDAKEFDVSIFSGAEDLMPVLEKNSNGKWIRNRKGDLVINADDHDGYPVLWRIV